MQTQTTAPSKATQLRSIKLKSDIEFTRRAIANHESIAEKHRKVLAHLLNEAQKVGLSGMLAIASVMLLTSF